jgi:dsRNA-specific ribonuclease
LDPPQAPAPRPIEGARELISRYPNLSETELARLINLYRELSALDMALMLSDESLAPHLDRFSADHRSRIKTPFRQYAALVGYAVVAIAAAAWAAASAS